MTLKIRARSSIRRAARSLAGATIFSKARRIRAIGFDALGAKQNLILCEWPGKETFIVSADDQIIGQEVFLSGEFDFNKFVAAYEVLLRHRNGRRPALLIDVGANIGTICIPALARGFVDRAIAIEPDPLNCRLLRANTELNELASRMTVHQLAAGPVDGESLELERSEYNLGDHRIRAPNAAPAVGAEKRHTVTVGSARLDTICSEQLDEDILVWMDVQGFEGFALAGSEALLRRKVPLVLEFWPAGMARSGSFPLLKSSLAEYGGFIDLKDPDVMRPISELQALHDEIGFGEDATTDILVL